MINNMHSENNNLSNNDREENLPEEQWINVNQNQMAGPSISAAAINSSSSSSEQK